MSDYLPEVNKAKRGRKAFSPNGIKQFVELGRNAEEEHMSRAAEASASYRIVSATGTDAHARSEAATTSMSDVSCSVNVAIPSRSDSVESTSSAKEDTKSPVESTQSVALSVPSLQSPMDNSTFSPAKPDEIDDTSNDKVTPLASELYECEQPSASPASDSDATENQDIETQDFNSTLHRILEDSHEEQEAALDKRKRFLELVSWEGVADRTRGLSLVDSKSDEDATKTVLSDQSTQDSAPTTEDLRCESGAGGEENADDLSFSDSLADELLRSRGSATDRSTEPSEFSDSIGRFVFRRTDGEAPDELSGSVQWTSAVLSDSMVDFITLPCTESTQDDKSFDEVSDRSQKSTLAKSPSMDLVPSAAAIASSFTPPTSPSNVEISSDSHAKRKAAPSVVDSVDPPVSCRQYRDPITPPSSPNSSLPLEFVTSETALGECSSLFSLCAGMQNFRLDSSCSEDHDGEDPLLESHEKSQDD